MLPIKTFYEKDGFLVNIEGRIRKFYKTVTSPEKINSLESFFVTLLRAQNLPHN
jgi:NADH dehydrogenase/NADH:ubiquinone oxidoreductase subunit G